MSGTLFVWETAVGNLGHLGRKLISWPVPKLLGRLSPGAAMPPAALFLEKGILSRAVLLTKE